MLRFRRKQAMKPIRIFFIVSLLAAALPARAAANDDQDWTAFGQMLTLMQTFVRIGMQPNPDQALADLLAGRDLQANQAIASLFAGATAEMPEEYRARVASIGRDIADRKSTRLNSSHVEISYA